MRSSPVADLFWRFGAKADRAIDRMPIRLIVRSERALGSCEFCTGLIQTDCSEIEPLVRSLGMGKRKLEQSRENEALKRASGGCLGAKRR
jgi:hypothetical protein